MVSVMLCRGETFFQIEILWYTIILLKIVCNPTENICKLEALKKRKKNKGKVMRQTVCLSDPQQKNMILNCKLS